MRWPGRCRPWRRRSEFLDQTLDRAGKDEGEQRQADPETEGLAGDGADGRERDGAGGRDAADDGEGDDPQHVIQHRSAQDGDAFGVSSLSISPSTRAVMPMLVAARMVPMNKAGMRTSRRRPLRRSRRTWGYRRPPRPARTAPEAPRWQ